MKIAWFTHRYHPCAGGSENYGREMVRRFVARGDQVEVITSNALELWHFTDPSRRAVPGPAVAFVDGARVERCRVRHFPGQRYAGRLLSYLPHWPARCCFDSFMPWIPGLYRDRGPYDAVFGVGFPYTAFSYAAWKAARASRAPLVLTPFLHLSTPGDAVNRAYTRPHQRRLLRESQLVVVQTEVEAAAIQQWGIPRTRLLKLGMALRHDQVTGGDRGRLRSRLAIPPERTVVGQLGANDPNKGTTHLVEAAARINATSRSGQPVHVLLAGPQSPAFEAFRLTLPPETSAWLSILGPIHDEERADFFAALDIFAMPSRTDSFGIVFLEAWANALPVVAAAAGGVVEVVRDGQDGLLVPFGDVEELTDRLRRLVEDPVLASRLGQAGARRVSRGYTWDDRFQALAAALDGCLAADPGHRSPAAAPRWAGGRRGRVAAAANPRVLDS
jgi:glycosyltransferase involved in cell wall biosynthesis